MLSVDEIMLLCAARKVEAMAFVSIDSWISRDKVFRVNFEHRTEAGDQYKICRYGATPGEAWNAAWDALSDLGQFGFTLPQAALEYQVVKIDDDIPF